MVWNQERMGDKTDVVEPVFHMRNGTFKQGKACVRQPKCAGDARFYLLDVIIHGFFQSIGCQHYGLYASDIGFRMMMDFT